MSRYTFLDNTAAFSLEKPENYSYLYFPIASDVGLKSAITPELGGDAKLDQNTFLLEPVSAENLHNNRNTRNFWCYIEGVGAWSAVGSSAEEFTKRHTDKQDESELKAGFMWHTLTRKSDKFGLQAEVTSFVPVDVNAEVMHVTITNTGKEKVTFTPTAVIPIYGRSADDLRDHRHVTSLLHRTKTDEYGVEVKPTLSFDERGHQLNHVTYFVTGCDENGCAPESLYSVVEDFIGEGGSYEWPQAVLQNKPGVKAGYTADGLESLGGLHFAEQTLEAGQSASYIILAGITKEPETIREIRERFDREKLVQSELEYVKEYWQKKVNVAYQTGDSDFDYFMRWVSFQPILRRIYGCSFLPHHDYGKGGRGWRDLWQDCLALLLMNPDGVRQMLLDNFAGVRIDGSNATIIGNKQGEFVADRNNITRVWMDHGVWPFMTTKLYIDQTGDIELLEKQVSYFKDKQVHRGTQIDSKWNDAYGCWQKNKNGAKYEGSVLEHMLVQHLTAFYEVGEHNEIRLRGADWNDALDMAADRGESVAFTNAYAGNLRDMAELLLAYREKTGKQTVALAAEMVLLLEDDEKLYQSVDKKLAVLDSYLTACEHEVSGDKAEICIEKLAANLKKKADFMMRHIRETEWVTDGEGNGWFNGYYDNHGERVEGIINDSVRMMLTGQVFSIMAGTADEAQVAAIAKSADKYLYREEVGGYRLNTDFKELKTDLGRMFGFSYGDKENGAVFSHMAVMYANALYKRGFAKEGFKSLNALEKQAMNFEVSRIYPGIPEYFNGRGRGMYHYLTGAASWYMLTVITEMFGIKGALGDMVLEPKLMAEQFDEKHQANMTLLFADRNWNVSYTNEAGKEYGEYRIGKVVIDGFAAEMPHECQKSYTITKEQVEKLAKDTFHSIEVFLV